VALDWLPRPRSPTDTLGDDTPVVLVLHGLTGGTCEPHVRWLLKMAQRRRWRAVLLNSRGCSGCVILLHRAHVTLLAASMPPATSAAVKQPRSGSASPNGGLTAYQ
jgi:predicted alpha/beta-fold hydrolase